MNVSMTERSSMFPAGLGWQHVVVPGAILCAATLIVSAIAGLNAVWVQLWSAFVGAVLVLLLTVPVVALAKWQQGAQHVMLAFAVVSGLLLISYLGTHLPRVGPFTELTWNWQGKTFDLVWTLAIIAMLPAAMRREIGWRLDVEPGTLSPALINIIVWGVIGFVITRLGMFGDPIILAEQDLTFERVLFDITHPNLVEEIIFRGLLLAALDHVFRPAWTVTGAKIGWGVIITAWLFGLVHGVQIEPGGTLMLDFPWLAQTFIMGLALGWVRGLTGSLWPAFLGHCAPEIGILLALASVGA